MVKKRSARKENRGLDRNEVGEIGEGAGINSEKNGRNRAGKQEWGDKGGGGRMESEVQR